MNLDMACLNANGRCVLPSTRDNRTEFRLSTLWLCNRQAFRERRERSLEELQRHDILKPYRA
ncbi:MAG: hypothetical protein OXB95_00685, partial [Rhodobacteraceae bacterium]|nr:hypothetical protein [Paracoccaceae bacterium]